MPLPHSSPNHILGRELLEVAEDAAALHEAVRSANALPEDFPASQLASIAASLSDLPNGTAEGCRVPLEYARARLPAIRREFVKSADHPPPTGDQVPAALRGEDLDRKLRNLISSVTTALDEYRRQATEEPNDSENADDASVPNPSDRLVHTALDEAADVERELTEAQEEISEHAIAGAERSEVLLRTLADARGLSRLATAELSMSEVVARWYSNISGAVQDYPNILKKAGNAIEVGVDVAEPFLNWWDNVWADLQARGIYHLREFAGALKKVGEELDRRRGKNGQANTRIVAGDDDYWPKQRIKDYFIEGKKIPTHVAESVTDLAFGNVNVKLRKLDSIGQFKNLQWLGLGRTTANLEPLRDLKQLSHLDLGAANWQAVRTLPLLPKLTTLDLSSCSLPSLEVIAQQTSLFRLTLDFCKIKNIDELARLVRLQSLSMVRTSVTDLNVIARLPNLKSLSIGQTQIADLTPLANHPALYSLNLSHTKVSDLTPLGSVKSLGLLYCNGTAITNLAPLQTLEELRYLQIGNTQVRDLTPLASITKFSWVMVHGCKIENRSGLTDNQIVGLDS